MLTVDSKQLRITSDQRCPLPPITIMSQSPTITNALVIPGIIVADAGWSVVIGLVVDDEQVAWSGFEIGLDGGTEEPDLGLNDGIRLLQEQIIPLLIGRPLGNVRPFMTQLNEMVYEVEVVRSITADSPPQKLSRRELFSGLVNPGQEIREVVERPLPPEMRLGVSLALLSAAAMGRGETVVETLARLYGLEPAVGSLPVHLRFDGAAESQGSGLVPNFGGFLWPDD